MTPQDRATLAFVATQLAVAAETLNKLTRSSGIGLQLPADTSKCADVNALKPFHRRGRALGPGKVYQVTRGGRPLWLVDYKDAAGKRRRIALSEDKQLAEAKARELVLMRDMRMLGLDDQSGADLQICDLRDRYLADLSARSVPEHVRNVRSRLGFVLAGIKAKRVADLRAIDLIEYRNAHLARGASRRTSNLDTDSMRAMFRWAKQVGLISTNPIESLPRLKESDATKKCRRRALSDEDIRRFLQAAADDDAAQHKRVQSFEPGSGGARWQLRGRGLRVPQAPLWHCFLEAGARYNETVRVTWADVDFDAKVLYVRAEHAKTGKPRELPLLRGLLDELRALRELHPKVLGRPLRDDDAVFLTPEAKRWPRHSRNIGRLFERLIERAGIDRVDARGFKIDVHSLRHAAATRYLRCGMPLTHAQYFLGHRDSRLTTSVYGHLEARDVRASIERIAPSERQNTAESGAA